MSESLRAARCGLYAALALCLPLALWLLSQTWLAAAEGGGAAVAGAGGMHAALFFHGLVLLLGIPWLMRYRGPGAHAAGLSMLLCVPLPLYLIAWAAGAVGTGDLLAGWGTLGLLALCAYGYFRACVSLIPAGQPRALVVVGSQLGLCLLLWQLYPAWVSGTGG